MAKRSKPASLDDIRHFHRDALDQLLSFCASRGIKTRVQLNSFKGRALLDVPLWKLLETHGKYGGRYVSQGVLALEEKLGRRPGISSGKWPESLLVRHFGPAQTEDGWAKHPDYCCTLEHVAERAKLIDAMLLEPHRAREILDTCLLGCVVLRSEHGRIASGELNPGDPWARYRDATPLINVWDRQANDWVLLESSSRPLPMQQESGA